MERLIRTCVSALAVTVCFGLLTPVVQAQGFCFDPAEMYTAGVSTRSVVAADLDGDGYPDLTIAGYISSEVLVLMNDGDGTFGAAVSYPSCCHSTAVCVANLDTDNSPDFAVTNEAQNNLWVRKNNGDGTFGASSIYGTGTAPRSLCSADLDGDGDYDLAVANYNGIAVSILKNNGDATFANHVDYSAGLGSVSITAADLDGDGDADLAVAAEPSGSVFVLKNNGNGVFTSTVNYAVGAVPNSVCAADLDGDFDIDLAVGIRGSGTVSILLNNGDATFAPAVNAGASSDSRGVYAADFDGDGDLDLAVANRGGKYVILDNNGYGSFSMGLEVPTATEPSSVFAADLDGNTTCDLVMGDMSAGNAYVLLNCRTPCVPAPSDLVLWLPLDEGTIGPSKNLVGPNDGTQYGSLLDVPGEVADALHFDGTSTYIDVAAYQEIFTDPDPGTGDFTIDAWVQRASGDNGVRVIAEKRANPAADTYVGFSFYMYNGRLGLQLANGAYTGWNTEPAEIVPPTGWHHVAVTVDRDNPSGGRFYLDGQQLGSSFDPTLRSGSLSSNASFRVGSISFSVSSVFRGDIDEVEMFSRSLGYLEIQALSDAQIYGKCKTTCFCAFHSDFDTDGFLTSLDLGEMIDILFAGQTDVRGPYCPNPRADFDCDGFSTSQDMGELIDHLFAGGSPPCDPCAR